MKLPKLTPVKSSQIAAIGYESGQLFVQFVSGALYDYQGVTKKEYDALLSASSVGQVFNTTIRAKKQFKKVTE